MNSLINAPNSATQRPHRRLHAMVAFAMVAAIGVAGCTSDDVTSADSAETSTQPPAPQAVIAPSFAPAATDVNPIDPIVLTVEEGTFDTVEMLNPEGVPVSGEFNAERTEWRAVEPLGYGRSYSISAEAEDSTGLRTPLTTSFTTLTPSIMTAAYTVTGEGTTVGVGQPVAVMFDEPIADRWAVQDAITVTTEPAVDGAFYWVSNQEVRWRPEDFWDPGTTIDVAIDIYGKDLGGGMYGQENAHTSFQIGDSVISRVDDANKQIVVERNGEVVRSMPTSMGKGDTPTPNGTYIIGDKQAEMVMDSSTYGVPTDSPDGYRTEVQYATRMSYSGIFVHAAPWSVWAQGQTNTSHGCLNVSTSDAAWFYDNVKRGDIVIVSGTVGPTLAGADGLGDWNIPWETWKAGNADVA